MNEENEEPTILDILIIAEYTDGTRELKTSIQDPQDVIELLNEVADEVYDFGLDANNFTMH